MKKQTLLFLSTLTAASISTAAVAADSIWDHNGSEMLLQANGDQRTISYMRPREGLAVQPGQVVFRGTRNGRWYSGTAYTFRRGCYPAPYQVSGYLESETRISLKGRAPRRAGCRVVGYNEYSDNSNLLFTFKRKARPTNNGGYNEDNYGYNNDRNNGGYNNQNNGGYNNHNNGGYNSQNNGWNNNSYNNGY